MPKQEFRRKQQSVIAEEMLSRMMPLDRWIASLSQEKKELLVRVFGKTLEELYKESVEAIKREISDPSPTWAKGHPKIPGSVRFGY